MGVGPGDEVICPAFTFYATAEAVVQRGATPVFADIDPATLNLDIEDAAAKITDRTKAIIPVHLFGRAMDVRPLVELGVRVLEDAAQAFGAEEVAQPRRGLDLQLLSDEEPLLPRRRRPRRDRRRGARRAVKLLAFHGSRDKTDFELVGYNSRLDEMQAAFLRIFLKELDGWNAGRRAAAARYAELGLGRARRDPAGRAGPCLPPLRLPLARARPHPRGARPRRASRRRRTTRRRSTCSRRCATSATSLARCRRPSRRRDGELLAAALAGDARPRRRSASSTPPSRVGRRRGSTAGSRVPFAGAERIVAAHSSPAGSAGDAVDRRRVVVARVPAPFRPSGRSSTSRCSARTILIVLAIKLVVFVASGFYNRWWRYVSIRDMWVVARGVVVASLVADLDRLSSLAGARLPAAALDRGDRSRSSRCPRRRLAPARAHRDRAARPAASSRAARR